MLRAAEAGKQWAVQMSSEDPVVISIFTQSCTLVLTPGLYYWNGLLPWSDLKANSFLRSQANLVKPVLHYAFKNN